jgi:hypothetical protein
MEQKKVKISVLVLLVIGLTGLPAQESKSTAGGNATGSGGTASYSVGQVVYTTNTGTNGSVAQGIQQPYEISVLLGVPEVKGISLAFQVYPNPATDYLRLTIKEYDTSNLGYQLYDLNGKLLEKKNFSTNEITISMQNRVQGTYFLKVLDKQKEVKTFKIIKH